MCATEPLQEKLALPVNEVRRVRAALENAYETLVALADEALIDFTYAEGIRDALLLVRGWDVAA